MKSHTSRLEKLESQQPATVMQYLCITHPDKNAAGYDVTRRDRNNLAVDSFELKPLHFETREALEEFERRPDVDLLIIDVVYADTQQVTP